MYKCLKCARVIDETRFVVGRDACPACGTPMKAQHGRDWISIARVTNLAEAGFLADELTGLGIEAEVQQDDEFSAVTDRWHAKYLIRVPPGTANEAAKRIREHLGESALDAAPSAAALDFLGNTKGYLEGGGWRPLVLVVAAGVVSFLLGQRVGELRERPIEGRGTRTALTTAITHIDRAFVTEAAPGEVVYRLYFDSVNRTWILDTDSDGDGHFDRRAAFTATGRRW